MCSIGGLSFALAMWFFCQRLFPMPEVAKKLAPHYMVTFPQAFATRFFYFPHQNRHLSFTCFLLPTSAAASPASHPLSRRFLWRAVWLYCSLWSKLFSICQAMRTCRTWLGSPRKSSVQKPGEWIGQHTILLGSRWKMPASEGFSEWGN